ncbi:MAG: hypothetical protein K6D96_09730 [Acetatifactor sp.]|nr:hypothetical protein [Acetatifactor sp.]
MNFLGKALPFTVCESQYENNKANWKEGDGGYIINQSALKNLQYGRENAFTRKIFLKGRPLTAATNSCEVIAVYNCLLYFKKDPDFPKLLYEFSKNGIVLSGVFGTSPKSIVAFLKNAGFVTEVYPGDKALKYALDLKGTRPEKNEAYIMMAYNEGHNPFEMIHSMSILPREDGFVRLNDGKHKVVFPTLFDAVSSYVDGRGRPLLLIKISKDF